MEMIFGRGGVKKVYEGFGGESGVEREEEKEKGVRDDEGVKEKMNGVGGFGKRL
ncbi:hypothetical protein [Bacillus pumilus]|uniref:hypothetical protein n=1 Tax=Bacillus pumilus TaxID=1408 RepID=UPI001643183E|nr:hypothetical protein [Bacillus pumilus]